MTPQRARAKLALYVYLSCRCREDESCHVDEYIVAIYCEHEVPDSPDAAASSATNACTWESPSRERANCEDCGKTFIGW